MTIINFEADHLQIAPRLFWVDSKSSLKDLHQQLFAHLKPILPKEYTFEKYSAA